MADLKKVYDNLIVINLYCTNQFEENKTLVLEFKLIAGFFWTFLNTRWLAIQKSNMWL